MKMSDKLQFVAGFRRQLFRRDNRRSSTNGSLLDISR